MAVQNSHKAIFEGAWEKAPVLQFLLDKERRVIGANQKAREELGLNQERIGKGILIDEFTDPANLQFFIEFLEKEKEGGSWEGEATLKCRNGSEIPVLETLYKQSGEEGDECIHLHAIDIRKRRKREEEFYQIHELLLTVNEVEERLVNDPMEEVVSFMLEELLACLELNRAFLLRSFKDSQGIEKCSVEYLLELGGSVRCVPEEFHERGFLEFGMENWRFQLNSGLSIGGNHESFTDAEIAILDKLHVGSLLVLPDFTDGEYWGALYLGALSPNREWSVIEENILKNLAAALGKSVSREQYHRYLLQAKIDAEMMAKSKTEFLSIMSHEIRTPMNAVVGMTHLLMMENPRDDQMEQLKLLNYSSDNLLHLINDILDFNKIDAGKVELETSAFSLSELCGNLIESLGSRAASRKNQLQLNCELEEPLYVNGDSTRMNQILSNLVNNALKFTENGVVSLKIQQNASELRAGKLHFIVSDTGIGIPKSKHKLIFERFEQANINTTRMYGGTGLGLAICKKLVNLFGGRIWVESEMGEGSAFHFVIPMRVLSSNEFKIEKSKVEELEAGLLEGKTVLLVEDNHINVLLEKRILQKWGCSVAVAENGKEGVECFKTGVFDYVLMDLHMPMMGGIESTQKIRLIEKKRGVKKKVPIILFSADAMSEKEDAVKGGGFDAFATKPFKPAELYALLFRLSSNE